MLVYVVAVRAGHGCMLARGLRRCFPCPRCSPPVIRELGGSLGGDVPAHPTALLFSGSPQAPHVVCVPGRRRLPVLHAHSLVRVCARPVVNDHCLLRVCACPFVGAWLWWCTMGWLAVGNASVCGVGLDRLRQPPPLTVACVEPWRCKLCAVN